MKKIDKKDLVFIILSLTALVAATAFIFTYGRAYIHADTALANRYGQAMKDHHSLFPATWNFVNTEIYCFRVTSLATFLGLFIKNQVFARAFATFLFMSLVTVAVICCARNVYKNNFWTIVVPIALVFLGGDESRNMILTEGTYMSELLAVALGVYFMYPIFTQLKDSVLPWKSIVLYGSILFIMTLGGQRYFAEHVIPIWVTCLMMVYIERNQDNNKGKNSISKLIGIFTAICMIPSVAGYIAYKWICSWHTMNAGRTESLTFVGSLYDVYNQFVAAIITTFKCFGYRGDVSLFSIAGIRNMVSLTICIMICFVVPVIQAARIKNESKQVQFLFIFGVIHNAILIIIAIFFGKCMERYLLSSIYVCILISCRYIWDNWISCDDMARRRLWAGLFAIATVVEVVSLLSLIPGYRTILNAHERVVNELKDHGLIKGYGTYWSGFMYELYSDYTIRFGEVDLHGTRFDAWLWNNDSSVYADWGCKSFLLLTQEEYEESMDFVFANFEPSVEGFVIPDVYEFDYNTYSFVPTNIYVYVFNYDIGTKISDSFANGGLTVKDFYYNDCAGVNQGALMIGQDGKINGPYALLEKGKYKMGVHGEKLNNLQISFNSEQDNDHIKYEQISATDTELTYRVVLDKSIDDFCVKGMNPVCQNRCQ